jgi:hypothetical protein
MTATGDGSGAVAFGGGGRSFASVALGGGTVRTSSISEGLSSLWPALGVAAVTLIDDGGGRRFTPKKKYMAPAQAATPKANATTKLNERLNKRRGETSSSRLLSPRGARIVLGALPSDSAPIAGEPCADLSAVAEAWSGIDRLIAMNASISGSPRGRRSVVTMAKLVISAYPPWESRYRIPLQTTG